MSDVFNRSGVSTLSLSLSLQDVKKIYSQNIFICLFVCLFVCFSRTSWNDEYLWKEKGCFQRNCYLIDWLDQARLSAEYKTKRVLIVSANEFRRENCWLKTDPHSIALPNQFVFHIWSSRDSLTPPKVKRLPDNCSRDLPSVTYLQNSLFSPGISPYISWFSGSAKFDKFLLSFWRSRKLRWPHRSEL
jgi:hypothetical protein